MTINLTKRELTILLFAVPQLQDVIEADQSGGWVKTRCLWEPHADGPFPATAEFNELVSKLYAAERTAGPV